MDEKTLDALKGSIAKWEEIVAGVGEDRGIMNCPLCKLFHDGGYDEPTIDEEGWPILQPRGHGCNGCPVKERTGEDYCDGSPYADDALQSDKDSEEYLKAAVHELEFLHSLLPPGVK